MRGLGLEGGDAESILSEILEFLEAREGQGLKASLEAPAAPDAAEAAPDVAALLGGKDAAKPCPVCGKAPCECAQEG
jgi:hypothetical protein